MLACTLPGRWRATFTARSLRSRDANPSHAATYACDVTARVTRRATGSAALSRLYHGSITARAAR